MPLGDDRRNGRIYLFRRRTKEDRESSLEISRKLIGTIVMISLVRGVRGFNWTSS